jgi:hypothetical protein
MGTRKPHRGRKTAGPAGQRAPAGPVGHGEFVVYPGVPAGIYDVLERLSAAAGDSPDFGTPGISLDRTRLTVRWFGALSPAVQAVVDSAGAGFEVVVQQTGFRPGDLRSEAERLAREHAPVVQAASARPEGDGIEVLISPQAAAAGGPAAALAEQGITSEVPLFAAVGDAAAP